jgi:pilus assembly protein Flp/PilA
MKLAKQANPEDPPITCSSPKPCSHKEEQQMRYLIPAYVKVHTTTKSLLNNEEGATMVEYALMVALIAAVAITAVTSIGTNVSSLFTTVASSITAP